MNSHATVTAISTCCPFIAGADLEFRKLGLTVPNLCQLGTHKQSRRRPPAKSEPPSPGVLWEGLTQSCAGSAHK